MHVRTFIGVISAGAIIVACGGDDTVGPPHGQSDAAVSAGDGAPPADGSADATSNDASSDAGDGGSTGDSGSGGDGGDGGGALAGRTGGGVVSGGIRAKSTNWVIVTTTGQAPGGARSMSSPGYKLNGGVVGATQGK